MRIVAWEFWCTVIAGFIVSLVFGGIAMRQRNMALKVLLGLGIVGSLTLTPFIFASYFTAEFNWGSEEVWGVSIAIYVVLVLSQFLPVFFNRVPWEGKRTDTK